MSTSILTIQRSSPALLARLLDYVELTKPRIVVMELIVAGIAACLAMPHALSFWLVFCALSGTALVAASASIANSWLERDRDGLMQRTASRPLPTGRASGGEALFLSGISLIGGLGILLWQVNSLTAALGLTSWLVYVAIYTPLKTRTPHNTAVGAVAGAIPVLMGWTATGAPLNLTALALATVVFLWQFPHFMAIAWLYRDDYKAGGHKMYPVVDPSGIRSGVQAVLGTLFLIPISLIPALSPTSGSPMVYGLWATGLGIAQLALAIQFAMTRSDETARPLLRATLIYLPALMVVLLMVTM